MKALAEIGGHSTEEEFKLPPDLLHGTQTSRHDPDQVWESNSMAQDTKRAYMSPRGGRGGKGSGPDRCYPFSALVRVAKTFPQEYFKIPEDVGPRKRRTRNNVDGKPKLHILQFNANGIGAADKRDKIIRYTEEHDVDALCLQETSLGISKNFLALQDGRRRAEWTEDNNEACTAECSTDTEAS